MEKEIVIWIESIVNDPSRSKCRNAVVTERCFKINIDKRYLDEKNFEAKVEEVLNEFIRITTINWFKCSIKDIFHVNLTVITTDKVDDAMRTQCLNLVSKKLNKECNIKINWAIHS